MTRLLVAGLSPLPFENARMSYGPGIRTWQFAWSLARAGHAVSVVAMRAPGYDHAGAAEREERGGVAIHRVSDVSFLDPSWMRRTIRDARPDAVVGASLYGSGALATAGTGERPFWADQFGHAMAEAQAKAAIEGRNWPVAHTWRLVAPVMRSADRVSVVSERQRYAAIGELGALGRLTAETCGYEFTAVIPCALVPEGETPAGAPGEDGPPVRGRLVPDDAFVVLWSGGFNVWSDVDTVVHGLEAAMDREQRVHLVATGGALAGHDTSTWMRFNALVERSPHRARFHVEGWLPADRVAGYVAAADLAVLADRLIYEGLLGSKNRVPQWMGAGLPVVYNRLGDLGDLLATGLGLTFPPGDAAALAERIGWAVGHPAELREMAGRARQAAIADLGFASSTRSLVAWAASPGRAPDAASRARIRDPGDHAGTRQRLTALARHVPGLRGNESLVRLWRRLSR